MRNGQPHIIKIGTRIPPEAHLALGLANLSTGKSKSVLVLELVEKRFRGSRNAPLRCLKPEHGVAQKWKRVSVFLPVTLKEKAEHEVERQLGAMSDKRSTVSLSAAIAALVVDEYTPAKKPGSAR